MDHAQSRMDPQWHTQANGLRQMFVAWRRCACDTKTFHCPFGLEGLGMSARLLVDIERYSRNRVCSLLHDITCVMMITLCVQCVLPLSIQYAVLFCSSILRASSCRPLHENGDWLGDDIAHVIYDNKSWCNVKIRGTYDKTDLGVTLWCYWASGSRVSAFWIVDSHRAELSL